MFGTPQGTPNAFGRVASTPTMPGGGTQPGSLFGSNNASTSQQQQQQQQQQQGGFGFGFGSATQGFGGGGAYTPGFGAAGGSSTPGFGAAGGSSTPGFGAAGGSSTPGFGATGGSSTPGFGAAGGSSTPGFGAAGGSSTLGFGAAGGNPTPGFGGTSTSTPVFGAAGGTSTSLFGGGSANPAFGGGGFSSPAFGGGTPNTMFGGGGSAYPQTTGGGFGTTMFGSSTPGTIGGFGATGMAGARFGTPGGTGGAYASAAHAPAQDINAVAAAYERNDANPNYRFRTFFYNVVPKEARSRPAAADVDAARWRGALAAVGGETDPGATEHDLWPVPASGFEDLAARLKEQESAIEENGKSMSGFGAAFRAAQRKATIDSVARLARARQTHAALQHRLLALMRKCVALDSSHPSVGRLDSEERDIADGFRALHDQMFRRGTSLPSRVAAVAAATRLRGSKERETVKEISATVGVDGANIAALFSVLQQQTDALKRLTDLLRRDSRDLSIIEEDLGSDKVEDVAHGGFSTPYLKSTAF